MYKKEQIEEVIHLSSYKNDSGDYITTIWRIEHEFDKLIYREQEGIVNSVLRGDSWVLDETTLKWIEKIILRFDFYDEVKIY